MQMNRLTTNLRNYPLYLKRKKEEKNAILLELHNFRQKKKYGKKIESQCLTFNLTRKIKKLSCKALPSSVFK